MTSKEQPDNARNPAEGVLHAVSTSSGARMAILENGMLCVSGPTFQVMAKNDVRKIFVQKLTRRNTKLMLFW